MARSPEKGGIGIRAIGIPERPASLPAWATEKFALDGNAKCYLIGIIQHLWVQRPPSKMPFITRDFIRTISAPFLKQGGYNGNARSALIESAHAATDEDRFDVFLAHACEDAEVVLGAKIMLELFGHRVYADWVDDPDAGYAKVTAEHADKMKLRMQASASLLFLTTRASCKSKWMPWLLGYFDGHKPGQVAILPITEDEASRFHGEDQLGFYPLAEYGLMPWKFHKTINIAAGDNARIELDRFILSGKAMIARS